MFGNTVCSLFSLYQKKAGLASRNIIHLRFLQRKGSTEHYQSGVVSEGEKFSFQWCDCFHDMLNRSPPVGLWRYKSNIIYYVTEEITSLQLAEDRPISIASLGRPDYQPLFREMSPRSSKGGTRNRESGGNQSSLHRLHPRDRSLLLGTELRKADRTVPWKLLYIFQYFVRHGLTSSGNVYNWEETLQLKHNQEKIKAYIAYTQETMI